jgi:hypothetical protein
MAATKYGYCIKNLTFQDDGPGFYRQVTRLSGESFGLDFHLEYGSYWAAGKMGTEPYGAHVHDYDQIILFMGTDTDNIGELGAEVELSLGEEGEKHMITTSTAVSVPRGLPHFPATINRMDQRFIYMEVSCAPECKETPFALNKEALESAPVLSWNAKYRDHIINMAFIRKGAWHYGPRNRDDSGGFLTFINSKNPEFDFLIMHETLKKAPYRFGPVPDKPHIHPRLEILTFMGADTDDLSELGGEVEVSLGKEAERHIITTPTAVVIPGGLPHCPVTVTRIDRPFILTDVRPFGSEQSSPKKP